MLSEQDKEKVAMYVKQIKEIRLEMIKDETLEKLTQIEHNLKNKKTKENKDLHENK